MNLLLLNEIVWITICLSRFIRRISVQDVVLVDDPSIRRIAVAQQVDRVRVLVGEGRVEGVEDVGRPPRRDPRDQRPAPP